MHRLTCVPAVVLFVGGLVAVAQRASTQTPDDDRAILALIESHAVAWNKRDIKAASDVYSDNATIATGSGRAFTGRAGVEQWHIEALSGPTPSTPTHPVDTVRIYFLRPDVAVADVESHSPGPAGADGQPGPTRKAPLFIVLMKTSGEWRVGAQRPTTLPVK
jgi:uncharacterized protein (TIGR02246 family)